MRSCFALLIFVLLFLSGCERNEERSVNPETEKKATPTRRPNASPSLPDGSSKQFSGQRQIPSIIETLHSLPDEKLALEIETLLEDYSEPDRDQLLTSIYEETDLRPSFVRLPILLELARQDTGKIGLRATILAQLRSTLKEDHGHSWPDWALALTEHLANTEGFLPTEGSSYDQ